MKYLLALVLGLCGIGTAYAVDLSCSTETLSGWEACQQRGNDQAALQQQLNALQYQINQQRQQATPLRQQEQFIYQENQAAHQWMQPTMPPTDMDITSGQLRSFQPLNPPASVLR